MMAKKTSGSHYIAFDDQGKRKNSLLIAVKRDYIDFMRMERGADESRDTWKGGEEREVYEGRVNKDIRKIGESR